MNFPVHLSHKEWVTCQEENKEKASPAQAVPSPLGQLSDK